MASIPLLSPPTAAAAAAATNSGAIHKPSTSSLFPFSLSHTPHRRVTRLHVSSPTISTPPATTSSGETIFFDGGAHYGDLAANLVLGFTLFWLPLTLAAVSRAMYLRYRFTNLRVSVISGLTGQDRSDFGYNVIKDVQVVPRFIGEWGDIIITLKDGTVVDLRSVPKFREIAKYCLAMSQNPQANFKQTEPKGF